MPADAVADKLPYERYVIEETRAAAYVDSGDYPSAIKSLEAVLTTGVLPPAEAAKRMLAAAQLAYQVKDYATVVEYADRYYRAGGRMSSRAFLWRRPITFRTTSPTRPRRSAPRSSRRNHRERRRATMPC